MSLWALSVDNTPSLLLLQRPLPWLHGPVVLLQAYDELLAFFQSRNKVRAALCKLTPTPPASPAQLRLPHGWP